MHRGHRPGGAGISMAGGGGKAGGGRELVAGLIRVICSAARTAATAINSAPPSICCEEGARSDMGEDRLILTRAKESRGCQYGESPSI